VHEVGAVEVGGDLQVDTEGPQRRVRAQQLGQVAVAGDRDDVVVVGVAVQARPVEGVDPDVDAAAQDPRQLGHVHPGTPVDVRRVLAGEEVDPHGCPSWYWHVGMSARRPPRCGRVPACPYPG
jgi:hypothetical protein